jgi:hypothetical protein
MALNITTHSMKTILIKGILETFSETTFSIMTLNITTLCH